MTPDRLRDLKRRCDDHATEGADLLREFRRELPLDTPVLVEGRAGLHLITGHYHERGEVQVTPVGSRESKLGHPFVSILALRPADPESASGRQAG